MRKRLQSAMRLTHLQDQKVRLVETEIVRIKQEIRTLADESIRLHKQIDETFGVSNSIIDLLFRRLDQLGRQVAAKQDQLALTLQKLTREKIRGEAAVRLKETVSDAVQSEDDKQSLLEIIERVGRGSGSSFR